MGCTTAEYLPQLFSIVLHAAREDERVMIDLDLNRSAS